MDAQIVNIERQRISTDTSGWFGHAMGSFAGSKTTKSILAVAGSTLLEYKSPSTNDLWLLITEISLIKSDSEKFSNSGFGHLRYNRKLGNVVRWELFTQIQYNSLTKIDQRILGGTGFRFKLTPYENARFYFGISYMYEYEKLLDPELYHKDHRGSSYFSFTLTPTETVTMMSTLYVQPLLKDAKDYRISNESSLVLGITKKLSLNASFKYAYDSRPPEGVPVSTYSFSNGIELQF
jgi:putative salt-induced outer membrane protein YdiY